MKASPQTIHTTLIGFTYPVAAHKTVIEQTQFSKSQNCKHHGNQFTSNAHRPSTRLKQTAFLHQYDSLPLKDSTNDSSKLLNKGHIIMKSGVDSHLRIAQTFQNTFGDRLHPWLLNRLQKEGFVNPTPVQLQALDLALPSSQNKFGKDVVIHAQTGSGKTLAYLLPAIMAIQPSRASVQAVVIAPTQELGMQIYKLSRRLVSAYQSKETTQMYNKKYFAERKLSTTHTGVLEYGSYVDDQSSQIGSELSISSNNDEEPNRDSFPVLPMVDQADLRRQKLQLRETAPRLIVGNPLRIAELVNSGRLRLDLLRVLVIDEFDACLMDDTTTSALQTILATCSRERPRQTIFASATVPQHRHFLRQCIRQKWTSPDIKHVWVEENSSERVPPSLSHYYALCENRKKLSALRALLFHLNAERLRLLDESNHQKFVLKAIVFIMSSRNVDALVHAVNQSLNKKYNFGNEPKQFAVGLINSSSIFHRRDALEHFRQGDAHVLISTDLAARGLDVEQVSHIFHFDLPTNSDAYLHRAGRAGRQGNRGDSIVLLSPGEEFVLDRFSNALDISFLPIKR